MNFCSDNASAACEAVMSRVVRANTGFEASYGTDQYSLRVEEKLRKIFEHDSAIVFPVATGTAANALALSVMCPSHGAVFCHRLAHVNIDECGAPELMTGGAKLIPIDDCGDQDGRHGKINPDAFKSLLDEGWSGVVHHAQPACLTITQLSEYGTAYSLDELKTLCDIAHDYGLYVHMDGARFANALVGLDCSPAEMSWKLGVDALSFGATKNGALGAEAVIFFTENLASEFGYKRKRAGHLFSKMRYISAQLEGYLDDDVWLQNARHANQAATRLQMGLSAISGVECAYDVGGNELFVHLPEQVVKALNEVGYSFYNWPWGGKDCQRLVTAWNTNPQDVEGFISTVQQSI